MTFPLKKLILSYLPDLENVWNEDPHGILSMHHLKEVNVEYCNGLANVFPASIAQNLVKLENLVVENCNGLMTIVAEDASRTNQELPCPCVRSLELNHLPMFKYFYYCSQQCNNFAHIKSHADDDVYNEKLLKGLSLGKNGVEMILRGKFQRKLLHNIQVLTLFRCESEVFPYKILKEVPNIEKLVLIDGTFMDIFKNQSPNNMDYSEELVLQLKVLHLEFLRGSVSIGLENSWIEPFVRNLETLKVIGCGSLKNLVECEVSFCNMTYLKVESCLSLSYLFTSSTAKSLSQLKKMKIKRCEFIEEIVSKEEGEESDANGIIFPKLSRLNLDCLRNLRKFYRGNLNFPSLEELSITNCYNMITLCTGTLKTDMLSEVILDGSGVLPLETNLNSTMQKEFLKQMSKVDVDFVYDGSRLQEIWDGSLQIPPDFCFSKLVKLTVGHCGFLSDAVLPFHLLPLLPKLETLKVRNCDYVKTIFDVSLDIFDFYFSKLATLIVEACPSLSDAVLPFYLLPLLPKLETLEVRNCDSVKSIFDVKCTTKHTLITFPLKKLVLCKLPNLETIWNEDPHGILCMQLLQKVHVQVCKSLPSVFPAYVAKDLVKLEDLVVEECERLMVIVAEDNITDPRGTNVEITFPCPCVRSLKLRDLPKFKYFYYSPLKSDIYKNMESYPEDQLDTEKRLSLGENGVKMILRGEFSRNLLHNLKVLALCFHLDAFRYEILEQVPNVEKLLVCDGFFKEIFCCESLNNVDYYSRFLLHLKVLHLESLQDFISIGLNLAAWRLLLSNLTCLKVKDELDEDEIIFPQLRCLNLEWLLELKRFYRGSLSFPSLKEFSVTNSDKMITLCSGTLKTAKLSHVKLEKFQEAIPLKFDLNYTMRKQFLIEMVGNLDCGRVQIFIRCNPLRFASFITQLGNIGSSKL
ncbi:uncharacterized protein LOC114166893 isoform X2 [Vigna unguiculata]|uniref:uncharacterized protein LOC114166893 isoform X2 n=1 Tax=Vigna unguiculata TaxID=3917 RepID=UPI00101616A1|nr:uncharacterized protein LOC114166893 isoform X2 [Vigna unguiculata]